jgi:glycosyltransferase involved in cell wall biosynthesis
VTLWKVRSKILGSGIARNVERTSHPRWCLFLGRVAPFRMPHLPATHQNEWQARELARALSEFGYNVDVVDFDERRRILDRDYDLVIDLHPRARPIYDGRLSPGGRRISYITGSNPSFSNAAERARLSDLEKRRGVSLRPRRQVPPFPKPVFESFDSMFLFGGDAAVSTYAEFRLPPVHRLVNSGYDDVAATEPERRDPKRFLFMASVGQVHKGLDLLLEVFAAEPDLSLVVCSMYEGERDFARAYRTELFRTPNIHAAGFMDVKSPAFRELQAGCGATILPSCSEGQCGSVTVAMSFGLPCIVSRICGVEEPELTTLRDCALGTIREAVREWADQPRPALVEQSERTLALMRRKYTPGDYARTIREALAATPGVKARAR